MGRVTIGIEKRVSLAVMELALRAVLEERDTASYFTELSYSECTGANRAKKAERVLRRLTVSNTLMPYIKEHKDAVYNMLGNNTDRALLFTAMMCSAYSIFYDTVSILGTYFHVQEHINRLSLLQKLSEKYGSNRALDIAYDCVMPMLIESGVIARHSPGVYEIVRQEKYSHKALEIYKQAYRINNPMLNGDNNFMSNPFFEFVR